MIFDPEQSVQANCSPLPNPFKGQSQRRRLPQKQPGLIVAASGSAGSAGPEAEQVELINAFNLIIVDEFECYKYAYRFEPEISNYAKEMICRKHLSHAVLIDEKHLYIPQLLQTPSRAAWIRAKDHEFLEFDVQLETEYVGEFRDRQFIVQELLSRSADILDEAYFRTTERKQLCEELLLNSYPGHVIHIRETVREDGDNSLAVFALLTSETIAIPNVYDRLLLIKKCTFRNFRTMFNHNLLRRRLISHHTGKSYQLEEVSEELKASSKMITRDGKDTETYKSFFSRIFGLTTMHDSQPIIFVKESDESKLIALLPEFCELIPKGNPIAWTVQGCREKFYRYIKLCGSDDKIQQLFIAWGFRFTTQHCSADYRDFDMIGVEKVFNRCPKSSQFTNTEWFTKHWKEFYRQPYTKPKAGDFQCWGLLAPPRNMCERILEGFFESLKIVAKEINIQIAEPKEIKFLKPEADATEIIDKLEDIYYDYGINFAIVILPGICRDLNLYQSLKQYAEQINLPLQIVLLPTLDCAEFFRLDIVANILSQINCKLGGIPWAIEMPFDHVMFIGIYVFGDCIGFCANTDPNSTDWMFKTVNMTPHTVEVETRSLGVFIDGAFKEYFKKHGRFPMQLVIIRCFDDEDGNRRRDRRMTIANDIKMTRLVLEDILVQEGVGDYSFVDREDLTPHFFYVETSDFESWPTEENPCQDMERTFSCMSPFFTLRSLFPTMYRVWHPHHFSVRDVSKIRRIQSLDSLRLSVLVQHFLYFNAATFAELPAVCMNARKIAYYSKHILNGRNIDPTDKFRFL